MAEEQTGRKDPVREMFIWTKLFDAFKVALDPKKLLLAALGILAMAIGWWLLSVVFYMPRTEPTDANFRSLLSYEADHQNLPKERVKELRDRDLEIAQRKYALLERTAGPDGTLCSWPWSEPRGDNPYLVVTGQTGKVFDPAQWLKQQVPVLLEPVVKFLSPVIYLLHPDAGGWNRIYFFLVILWTLAVWGLFGGAITRMAAVQVARTNEKVGMVEALRFAWARYMSFFSAPLFPLILVGILVFFLILYGLVGVFTVFFGDIIVYGLFWPLVIIFGLIMAVVLVGLVGWPLMYATISAEGSDSFDALSRSYSYVYQAPWQYLWYSFVALLYGMVVVFFVGFMGSLMVYLGKWAVNQTPWADSLDAEKSRETSYLFNFAPRSFGWRDLLLQGSPWVYTSKEAEKFETQLKDGKISKEEMEEYKKYYKDGIPKAYDYKLEYVRSFTWYNYIGAGLVGFWLTLIFMLVVGFGYSYFWCSSTIIYLLMRRKVDDTDLEEVHMEEEEPEEPYTSPVPAAGAPSAPAKPAAPPGTTFQEGLAMRPSTPPAEPPMTEPAPEPPKTETPPPPSDGSGGTASPTGDGPKPPEGGAPAQ